MITDDIPFGNIFKIIFENKNRIELIAKMITEFNDKESSNWVEFVLL